MAVDGVSNTNTDTNVSALTSTRQGIADNFDTFLSILTTQLKNQNPLEPLDTNQFTQQLVQFSSVEQQLKTNEFLEALLGLNESTYNVNSQAVSFIGKEITTNTSASQFKDGEAKWAFSLDKAAAKVTFTIKDANGVTVDTVEMENAAAGESTFKWDGKLADGTTALAGNYSISIAATDVAGKAVTAKTSMTGIVSGVDMSGDEPYLIVGNARIALDSVQSVRIPS
jgi:flagellar basal-body rod modification protein FlgD